MLLNSTRIITRNMWMVSPAEKAHSHQIDQPCHQITRIAMTLRESWRLKINNQTSILLNSPRSQAIYKKQWCKSTMKILNSSRKEDNSYLLMGHILVLMLKATWSKWQRISISRLKKLKQKNSSLIILPIILKLHRISINFSLIKINSNWILFLRLQKNSTTMHLFLLLNPN